MYILHIPSHLNKNIVSHSCLPNAYVTLKTLSFLETHHPFDSYSVYNTITNHPLPNHFTHSDHLNINHHLISIDPLVYRSVTIYNTLLQ